MPLALILLGASFARIKIPRPLSRLPIMAMLLVTLAKMVVLPVIGVAVVQAMVHGGLIPADAKAETVEAKSLFGPLLRLGVFEREWVSASSALVACRGKVRS